MIEDFKQYLQHALSKTRLPGEPAQQKMSPKFPGGQIPSRGEMSNNTRNSSVLMALCPDKNSNVTVLLTLRSKHLNHHSRQISFPGGKIDEGETVEQTALREAYEEVHLHPDLVSVLGELTGLYVQKSDNYVRPIVGFCETTPQININPLEVEQAFFVPLNELERDENVKYKKQQVSGFSMIVPYWDIHHTIPLWGATAMMLSELVTLYELFLKQKLHSP